MDTCRTGAFVVASCWNKDLLAISFWNTSIDVHIDLHMWIKPWHVINWNIWKYFILAVIFVMVSILSSTVLYLLLFPSSSILSFPISATLYSSFLLWRQTSSTTLKLSTPFHFVSHISISPFYRIVSELFAYLSSVHCVFRVFNPCS